MKPHSTVPVALLALLGLWAPACSRKEAAAAPVCPTCVIADARGFTPSSLSLAGGKAGETRDVTFTRTSDDTCARDVVFPELGIKQPLPLNQPVVIRVPVDAARTLTFQCGMAMYKSSVVVTAKRP